MARGTNEKGGPSPDRPSDLLASKPYALGAVALRSTIRALLPVRPRR